MRLIAESNGVPVRRVLLVLTLCSATALLGTAASASASPIPSEDIGVNTQPEYSNGQWVPTDLSTASSSGVGVVRMELDQGNKDADVLMTLAAEAHLRMAPMLGLSAQDSPSAAATAMAGYVKAFAERYGPGGSFWKQYKLLPYLPVDTYEIGDEPNIPLQYVQDGTHLHWSNPADYAEVYEAARAALHQVDSSGIALVGGLADSDATGVSLAQDEQWLAALNPSTVDGVGYHPYTWQGSSGNLTTMSADTEALRGWMNAHGMQNAPIEINEVGACDVTGPGCPIAFSSANWGSFEAGFMEWALCTPSVGVRSFVAEYWGAEPTTNSDPFLALVSGQGAVTPYGQDYLAAAHTLTSGGCPPPSSSPAPLPGLLAMHLQLRGVHVLRHRLTVLLRVLPGSGHVTVVAVRRHRRVRLHLIRRHRGNTLLAFAVKLPPGRWTVVVTGSPPAGYATPAQLRRHVRIPRR